MGSVSAPPKLVLRRAQMSSDEDNEPSWKTALPEAVGLEKPPSQFLVFLGWLGRLCFGVLHVVSSTCGNIRISLSVAEGALYARIPRTGTLTVELFVVVGAKTAERQNEDLMVAEFKNCLIGRFFAL